MVKRNIPITFLVLFGALSNFVQADPPLPKCEGGYLAPAPHHTWLCMPAPQGMPVKMHEPTICDRDSDCVGNLRCDFAMTPRLPGAGFCLPPRHPNAEPKVSSADQPKCESGLHPEQDPNGIWICWAN